VVVCTIKFFKLRYIPKSILSAASCRGAPMVRDLAVKSQVD
jgi:hypothetical protein